MKQFIIYFSMVVLWLDEIIEMIVNSPFDQFDVERESSTFISIRVDNSLQNYDPSNKLYKGRFALYLLVEQSTK